MNKKHLRRWGWAVYTVVGLLAIIFLLVGFKTNNEFWKAVLLNLSTEFLGITLFFFLVKEILGWHPEEVRKEDIEGIISEKLSQLQGNSILTYPSRDNVYATELDILKNKHWEKVRIFAPMELWKPQTDKNKTFNELAKYSKQEMVDAIWAVFGLPPITYNGKDRPRDTIIDDLEYTKKMLSILANLT